MDKQKKKLKKVTSKNGIGNFRGLRVFDFGLILKSKTPKSRKYLRHFWIPRNVFYLRKLEISEVSKFSILALILKWKNQKTRNFFQRLIIVLLEEVGNFRGFRVFDLALILKSKSRKIRNYSQHLQIPRNVFYLRKLEISDVSEFLILALILKSKNQKTRYFFQDL